MVAALVEPEAGAPAPPAALGVVEAPAGPSDDELQVAARATERTFEHRALIGVLVGMPVCAVIWVGIVALALTLGDAQWDVWPALGVGAAVGAVAGAFLGGWAGVMWGAEQLEEAELHIARRH